ncbi:MAG TPA: bifunctional UDP-N-acetylmuramoyl-tripeptide:D-alanyl-D-alanine ligase/alanine racemase [Bacteroidia bacterium]|nr:bifunctional UDP-N-acetylmuramoyl-tripeptide:D-alanyl-D-alanine ligase/alanine racemase [Bacteroidia bacterium]
MKYTIQNISEIINGKLLLHDDANTEVRELLTDSRKIISPGLSLFFAFKGVRHDGHRFIEELIKSGVKNFVVSEFLEKYSAAGCNFIVVDDALAGMQTLAAHHRGQFNIPVIGITGSNGKTIIKEWLYLLLRSEYNMVRSPKSYNSQVGVPLSVWQMNESHTLGIFEAGISKPGEMEKLSPIIKPTLGIFSNIGQAHDENFKNHSQKILEKLRLFSSAEKIIYCKDYLEVANEIPHADFLSPALKFFTWSRKSKADLQITKVNKQATETTIQAIYNNRFCEIKIPFTDEASVENSIHCWVVMLKLGYEQEVIVERMQLLTPIAMRLELKEGINNCSVINDSYNSDLGSLSIALDFLNQQKQHPKKTIVLSDILQSGKDEAQLYSEVASLLRNKNVDRLIGIGESISRQQNLFGLNKSFYPATEDFLRDYSPANFSDETVLLKGARPFGFERISKLLQQKSHETVFEINLNAILHNLNYYRSRMNPSTKIMAMVKAFSYGSGSFEIASMLQYNKTDYLAVAYADEGVELRKTGITLPIMVMNPELQSFETMLSFNLEPEIYNFRLLNRLSEVLIKNISATSGFPVHIKLDTGMHRLGFVRGELNELIVRLKNSKRIKVQSVFSHLAASEEAAQDDFTQRQVEEFDFMCREITKQLGYPVIRHLLNSAGIIRFPEAQYDMVRIGIGLHGIAPSASEQKNLLHTGTLRTTISQIKNISAGETIGYNRKAKLTRDSQIATVAIGYADGLNRKLGYGKGKMFVSTSGDGKGTFAPIIGSICMDMTMLDVTDVPAREGDEVIVLGDAYTVSDMANDLGTIPYEILCGISQRVKRVYFQE